MQHETPRAPMHQAAEVPVEFAFEAARTRSMRLTDALIVAEAQIEHWRKLYFDSEGRAYKREQELQEELGRAKELMERRTRTLRRRAEAAEAAGGVEHGGEDEEDGPAVQRGAD